MFGCWQKIKDSEKVQSPRQVHTRSSLTSTIKKTRFIFAHRSQNYSNLNFFIFSFFFSYFFLLNQSHSSTPHALDNEIHPIQVARESPSYPKTMISIIRDRQSQTSFMIISVLIIIYWRFLHFVVCFLTSLRGKSMACGIEGFDYCNMKMQQHSIQQISQCNVANMCTCTEEKPARFLSKPDLCRLRWQLSQHGTCTYGSMHTGRKWKLQRLSARSWKRIETEWRKMRKKKSEMSRLTMSPNQVWESHLTSTISTLHNRAIFAEAFENRFDFPVNQPQHSPNTDGIGKKRHDARRRRSGEPRSRRRSASFSVSRWEKERKKVQQTFTLFTFDESYSILAFC